MQNKIDLKLLAYSGHAYFYVHQSDTVLNDHPRKYTVYNPSKKQQDILWIYP